MFSTMLPYNMTSTSIPSAPAATTLTYLGAHNEVVYAGASFPIAIWAWAYIGIINVILRRHGMERNGSFSYRLPTYE